MKNVLMILSVLAFVAVNNLSVAQEIKWMEAEEAQALNAKAKTSKLIIMDVYTKWCGPCKYMDKMTFQNADVIDFFSSNFHAVKFDGERQEPVTFNGVTYENPGYVDGRGNGRNSMHNFTQFLKIAGYPSLVIFNEKGEEIMKIVGYKTPEQLLPILKKVVEEHPVGK